MNTSGQKRTLGGRKRVCDGFGLAATCGIIVLPCLFLGCGKESYESPATGLTHPSQHARGLSDPIDSDSLFCFDFRGFSVYVDSTDEAELLHMLESHRGIHDPQSGALSWDGQIWGVDRTSFASIYVSYAGLSDSAGWNRFDNRENTPAYSDAIATIIGRSETFGWMGLARNFIYTTTDIEDAPPIRASADVLGQIFPFMIDAEEEFIRRYAKTHEDRFEIGIHELNDGSTRRLATWKDDGVYVHQILHIYDSGNAYGADQALRLIFIMPDRGRSRVVFVRFRGTPCKEKIIPRRPEDLKKAYPQLIVPELVESFPEPLENANY